MAKSSREVIRLLRDDGWFEAGQTGSHLHFKHPIKRVPHPLTSIEKQSGVKLT